MIVTPAQDPYRSYCRNRNTKNHNTKMYLSDCFYLLILQVNHNNGETKIYRRRALYKVNRTSQYFDANSEVHLKYSSN